MVAGWGNIWSPRSCAALQAGLIASELGSTIDVDRTAAGLGASDIPKFREPPCAVIKGEEAFGGLIPFHS